VLEKDLGSKKLVLEKNNICKKIELEKNLGPETIWA